MAVRIAERGKNGMQENGRVEELAAGLKALVIMGMDAAAAILARTLPQLAQQNDAGKAALLDHFSRYLDLAGLDSAAESPGAVSSQVRRCCMLDLLQQPGNLHQLYCCNTLLPVLTSCMVQALSSLTSNHIVPDACELATV